MTIPSNENWQAGKNVLGCNEYMFINQLYSDVTFKVGTSRKDVKAHKYVLASRSSVFATMLYGSLSETSDVIVVPDIEPDEFDTLFKYVKLKLILLIFFSFYSVINVYVEYIFFFIYINNQLTNACFSCHQLFHSFY